VGEGPVIAGPAPKVPAAAVGAAATAAATAPATNSGFMSFNFANIFTDYHLHTRTKHRIRDPVQPMLAAGENLLQRKRRRPK
jgi:hypothetical protein